jgi:hypothetical protein
MISQKRFQKVIDEISEESCECRHGFCFFREFVKSCHPDIRVLIQLECIFKFKYEESERQKCDIGNEKAMMIWVESGLAKQFAEVYNEDSSFSEVYKKTIEGYNENK